MSDEDVWEATCGACNLAGKLLCCDLCPQAFHWRCAGYANESEGPGDKIWKCWACSGGAKKWQHPSAPLKIKPSENVLVASDNHCEVYYMGKATKVTSSKVTVKYVDYPDAPHEEHKLTDCRLWHGTLKRNAFQVEKPDKAYRPKARMFQVEEEGNRRKAQKKQEKQRKRARGETEEEEEEVGGEEEEEEEENGGEENGGDAAADVDEEEGDSGGAGGGGAAANGTGDGAGGGDSSRSGGGGEGGGPHQQQPPEPEPEPPSPTSTEIINIDEEAEELSIGGDAVMSLAAAPAEEAGEVAGQKNGGAGAAAAAVKSAETAAQAQRPSPQQPPAKRAKVADSPRPSGSSGGSKAPSQQNAPRPLHKTAGAEQSREAAEAEAMPMDISSRAPTSSPAKRPEPQQQRRQQQRRQHESDGEAIEPPTAADAAALAGLRDSASPGLSPRRGIRGAGAAGGCPQRPAPGSGSAGRRRVSRSPGAKNSEGEESGEATQVLDGDETEQEKGQGDDATNAREGVLRRGGTAAAAAAATGLATFQRMPALLAAAAAEAVAEAASLKASIQSEAFSTHQPQQQPAPAGQQPSAVSAAAALLASSRHSLAPSNYPPSAAAVEAAKAGGAAPSVGITMQQYKQPLPQPPLNPHHVLPPLQHPMLVISRPTRLQRGATAPATATAAAVPPPTAAAAPLARIAYAYYNSKELEKDADGALQSGVYLFDLVSRKWHHVAIYSQPPPARTGRQARPSFRPTAAFAAAAPAEWSSGDEFRSWLRALMVSRERALGRSGVAWLERPEVPPLPGAHLKPEAIRDVEALEAAERMARGDRQGGAAGRGQSHPHQRQARHHQQRQQRQPGLSQSETHSAAATLAAEDAEEAGDAAAAAAALASPLTEDAAAAVLTALAQAHPAAEDEFEDHAETAVWGELAPSRAANALRVGHGVEVRWVTDESGLRGAWHEAEILSIWPPPQSTAAVAPHFSFYRVKLKHLKMDGNRHMTEWLPLASPRPGDPERLEVQIRPLSDSAASARRRAARLSSSQWRPGARVEALYENGWWMGTLGESPRRNEWEVLYDAPPLGEGGDEVLSKQQLRPAHPDEANYFGMLTATRGGGGRAPAAAAAAMVATGTAGGERRSRPRRRESPPSLDRAAVDEEEAQLVQLNHRVRIKSDAITSRAQHLDAQEAELAEQQKRVENVKAQLAADEAVLVVRRQELQAGHRVLAAAQRQHAAQHLVMQQRQQATPQLPPPPPPPPQQHQHQHYALPSRLVYLQALPQHAQHVHQQQHPVVMGHLVGPMPGPHAHAHAHAHLSPHPPMQQPPPPPPGPMQPPPPPSHPGHGPI